MHRHSASARTRIRRVIDHVVRPAIHPETVPLEIAVHEIHGEPADPAQARAGPFRKFEAGSEWGAAWDTAWFRLTGRIPREWEGRTVVAVVDIGYTGLPGFGAEAIVWEGDEPVRGISPEHNEHLIVRVARGGEQVEVMLEAAANPPAGWGSETWPLLMPDPGGEPLFVMSAANLAVVATEVRHLCTDLAVALGVAQSIPEDQGRHHEIIEAASEACRLIDAGNVAATAEQARAALKRVLESPAGAGAHRISAMGHAHIDTAWLWPFREARRKCARTFATALSLMDEYPEYRFVASAAQHFDWMKSHYPGLFARMKEAVARGAFEPVGSMWVETDTNLASGESLVRQLLHGKRFFAEELGRETLDVWLPDTFGHPASLPQIMAGAGVRWFLMHKLSWNQYNAFPHSTFWWEGIDGTRVFTHIPPAGTYNGSFEPPEIAASARNFKEHGRSSRSAYLFGLGDGGGGPTAGMLEAARRLRDLDGMPRVEQEGAARFFEGAEAGAGDLPVWSGELYLEMHRGTYTTQARTKRANRKCELALQAAEMWSCAARTADPSRLEQAWRKVLLCQFHDVLPGTSIHLVYEDARRLHAEAASAAAELQAESLAAIAGGIDTAWCIRPVAVFNALGHARSDVVSLRLDASSAPPSCARGPDGHRVPVQMDGDTALFAAAAPPFGWSLYDLTYEAPDDLPAPAAGEGWIENEFLRAEWDRAGVLRSVWDRAAGREVLPPGARANLFQLHEDRPNAWDAWDVDAHYLERAADLDGPARVEVAANGPVRAAVRFTREFGASRITQTMSLSAGSPLLRFDTEVDWHEEHKLLKAAFPIDVHTREAICEIQFGHVRRPTHANTRWDAARFEFCAHRWVELAEADYGAALINDCKYGHDARDGVLRLSLLRAPTWPDPIADRGRHEFAYALFPHSGDFRRAGVIAQASGFNVPLTAVACETGRARGRGGSWSLLTLDHPGVVCDGIKPAEDGDGIIARLYESWGGRRRVKIDVARELSGAWRTDLLERPVQELPVTRGVTVQLELRPFEISSVRFKFA